MKILEQYTLRDMGIVQISEEAEKGLYSGTILFNDGKRYNVSNHELAQVRKNLNETIWEYISEFKKITQNLQSKTEEVGK